MHKIKQIILSVPGFRKLAVFVRKIVKSLLLFLHTKKVLNNSKNEKNRIFYIGIPAHANLGDLAQGMCIRRWLKKHYPERAVVEIETNALVNTYFSCLGLLQRIFREEDFIVLQSGYTTTDLGGYADEMHRAVMQALPDARILMLPQTVFFKNEKNKEITSKVYNGHKKMLFLARDRISFNMSKEMFPDISVECYPDIVTTLIGNKKYTHKRDGILFCCRNDGEKYYSDEDLNDLITSLSEKHSVKRTDTTKVKNSKKVVLNAEEYINAEIEEYSKYKLIITDRYHGTIFSLVAGTPVIIIKTTDHKVVTGADWFEGVYDNHVFVAKNLDEAYNMAIQILSKETDYKLESYFEREYYDKLPQLFQNIV